jgi:hypothetical protein
MSIAGLVSGGQLDGIDPELCQLIQHALKRQLGQQWGKDSQSHDSLFRIALVCVPVTILGRKQRFGNKNSLLGIKR